MAASRPHPPADHLFRHTLVTTSVAHGTGAPVRLRLLALLIVLVIAAMSAGASDRPTADESDHDTHRSIGFGHRLIAPALGDAE
jgi:hypothetical protein